MREKTFKDTIATGAFTLPVAILFAAGVWALGNNRDLAYWASLGAAIFTTLIVRLISNSMSLIRIRSWLISSVYIVFCGVFTFLHVLSPLWIAVIAFLIAQYFLMDSYQVVHPERTIFQSFFFLGIASLIVPPLLYMSLVFCFAMLIQLRAFTLRALLAACFGLLIPFEFYAGYHFIFDQNLRLYDFWIQLVTFDPLQVPRWEIHRMACFITFAFIFIISTLHYARTNFNDKIRTRMYYYIFITQEYIFIAYLLLQPRRFNDIFPFIVLNGSPTIGHYFALSRGRWAAFFFYLSLLAILLLTVFNLWGFSFPSF